MTAAIVIAVFVAYWVPAFIALIRNVPHAGSIFILNLFLGWTVIGWIILLAMACRTVPARGEAL